jgi:hypothetical protein
LSQDYRLLSERHRNGRLNLPPHGIEVNFDSEGVSDWVDAETARETCQLPHFSVFTYTGHQAGEPIPDDPFALGAAGQEAPQEGAGETEQVTGDGTLDDTNNGRRRKKPSGGAE